MIPLEPWFRTVTKMVVTEADWLNEEAPGPVATAWFDNLSPGLERAWHAVATSDEVGTERPFGITLLGRPWALARLRDGLVAFEDRCPHRMAPLRIGSVCGGATLQCAYHGWHFDGAGRCVAIPALGADAAIPPRARVATAAPSPSTCAPRCTLASTASA